MIRKVLSILGILVLAGFLINGVTMTQNMKKLHAGLEDNLESTEKLNDVQAAVIDKNEELKGMLVTVDKVNGSLDETTDKTDQTLELLSQVVDYNADTLRLNNQMLKYSTTSGENIKAVGQSLKELSPYMDQLDAMLKDLDKTAAKDEKHLREILKATRSLNNKTPGGTP
ncbi:hypothetical protein C8P63_1086 [Melghirimyces profundicolus]|uniref:Uncharacterized protein n=1 Tax=Melghirimyces profundicolus TaxID=1242148 RepID=A0A2T6BXK6_9BACL|nr:hypothetical protein [Melghirimyces profundicolus]PTX60697.1 hypothetical protein C8P63_1086 [Melghirimyces profundicolus]